MRGFAIVSILWGHALHRVSWSAESRRWADQLLSNATVYFVFIAGYLLWHLHAHKTKFSHRVYLRNKARTVLTPYLVWSIPMLVAFVVEFRPEPDWVVADYPDLGAGRAVVYLAMGAHIGPLWFIPVILIFYLLAPMWSRIGRSRERSILGTLLVLIVVSLVIPRLPMRDEMFPVLRRVLHFASPYLLGIAVARFRAEVAAGTASNCMAAIARRTRGERRVAIALAVATALAMAAIGATHHRLAGSMNYGQKMLLCLALLPALASRMPPLADRALDHLAVVSFGLYFVHLYVMEVLTIGIGWQPQGIAGAVGICGSTLVCSAALVEAIRVIAGPASRRLLGTSGR